MRLLATMGMVAVIGCGDEQRTDQPRVEARTLRAGSPAEGTAVPAVAPAGADPVLQEGDIVFQQSSSSQSEAIALATGSRYTHMGIIIEHEGRSMVLEAVQPVSVAEYDDWVARGVDGHVVVKRLADARAVLTPAARARMAELGQQWLGRPYDIQFNWGDDELYCSELVYKLYERAAGVRIGEVVALRSFDINHPVVLKKLAERYGDSVPLDEPVISPQSMFESPRLTTIYSHP